MTKIIAAKSKISRSLGVNLWGKANDAYLKKNYGPGQHGRNAMGKKSVFGEQLKEKQKFKFYYGMTEKHLRRAYEEAKRRKGDTGEQLVGLLERRLAAVVYRSNLAPTMFAARQLVSHKHILVNGRKVNISSYLLKPGDVVALSPKLKENVMVMESVSKMERSVPEYLEFNAAEHSVKFIRVPQLAEIPYPNIMHPKLVVEFYSR